MLEFFTLADAQVPDVTFTARTLGAVIVIRSASAPLPVLQSCASVVQIP